MNLFAKVLIALIVFTGIGLFIGEMMSRGDTSDWQQYENNELGYKVFYPAGWYYREDIQGLESNTEDEHGFSAIFMATDGPPIFYDSSPDHEITEEEISIDGQRAMRENYFVNGLLSDSSIIFTDDEGEVMPLKIYLYFSEIEKDSRILEQILSTFEFNN